MNQLSTNSEFDQCHEHEVVNKINMWPPVIPFEEYAIGEHPVSRYPAFLNQMIKGVSEFTQTPIEMSALMALGALSASIGNKVDVEIKIGYKEPLNLYVAPALGSGNRKTAVVNHFSGPLFKWQKSKQLEAAPEIRKQKALRKSQEQKIDKLQKEISDLESQGSVGLDRLKEKRKEIEALENKLKPVPEMPLRIVQDVTPEKLGIVLGEQNEQLAIISDEPGIFGIIQGRYGEKINIDIFLKSHSGSPHVEHRVSRGPVNLEAPCLTIAVSPQPSVLEELAQDKELRGRGILARFLYAVPPSTVGHRKIEVEPLDNFVLDAYHTRLTALADLSGPKQTLTLSPAAYKSWVAFSECLEVEFRPGGSLEHILDWGGKLAGASARIAGLFHLANNSPFPLKTTEIPKETMDDAIAVAQSLIPHAQIAFGKMGLDPNLSNAKEILDWIKRLGAKEITRRQIQTAMRSRFPRAIHVNQALDVLEERNFGRRAKVVANRRPSDGFIVNPEVSPAALL